jgi:NADPH:quinone reductase-like Zn-dependent oxidoreductase
MIDDGELKPFVGRVYQLEQQVREAWKDAQSNHVEGKVVFSVA